MVEERKIKEKFEELGLEVISIASKAAYGFFSGDPLNYHYEIDAIKTTKPMKQVKIILSIVNQKKNTIVVKFNDKTLGIVKCNGEKFDIEKGIAMAIVKAQAKHKYDEMMEMLKGLDDKTAIKAEKAFVVYWAKKIVGKTQFEATVSNHKNLQKEVK